MFPPFAYIVLSIRSEIRSGVPQLSANLGVAGQGKRVWLPLNERKINDRANLSLLGFFDIINDRLGPTNGWLLMWMWNGMIKPNRNGFGVNLKCKLIILQNFAKNSMNMKEFGPRRGTRVPGASPLDLPLQWLLIQLTNHLHQPFDIYSHYSWQWIRKQSPFTNCQGAFSDSV